MKTVNIHDAKTHLSKLIARARKGEEIVLAKAGKPVAKIVPFEAAPKRREPGHAKGLVKIYDNFDDPLPEEFLRAFEGRE
ncbi:MAG: type II toxin-antitoxin system Phd/YefM family antitoxin [Alphaproteobacteria bacterium]|nr:type II toxin-antitoxin system Phd/YefM family antitoxin [Alphaproteobacteria bacterium]MBM3951574.1 type II toxin-antitoxin system Phd/YefM family antitoxin [Rhodospirillales bacterium]